MEATGLRWNGASVLLVVELVIGFLLEESPFKSQCLDGFTLRFSGGPMIIDRSIIEIDQQSVVWRENG